jgi:hypothetical protein
MQRAFVIRPFDKKQNLAGKTIDFEAIHVPTDGTKAANRGMILPWFPRFPCGE